MRCSLSDQKVRRRKFDSVGCSVEVFSVGVCVCVCWVDGCGGDSVEVASCRESGRGRGRIEGRSSACYS